MFLKKIDFLSPSLTLYYFGQHSHINIVGGILTIIAYFISFLSLCYFSFDLIKRRNPTTYSYNKNIFDVGVYKMDSSSMFHFIRVVNKRPSPKILQIIGFENLELIEYANNGLRENYNHFIYNICNENTIKSISKDILSIIDKNEFLTDSYCIESFYNSTTGIITKYNEKNFTYPSIKHGTSHPNRTFYSIFIQRCINSSINNYSCDTFENIENKIYGISFDLKIINFDIDINNFKNPLINTFISITSGFSPSTFFANHLNFQPLQIKSHNGLILDYIIEEKKYKFDINEKQIWQYGKGIIGTYYFWMQHNLILYERIYKRIQNVLADFGGITKTMTLITSFFNWIICKYTLIKDIQQLLFSLNNLKNKSYTLHNFNFSFDDLYNSNMNLNLNNSVQRNNNRNSNKHVKHSQIIKIGMNMNRISDNFFSIINNGSYKKNILKKNEIKHIFNKKTKLYTYTNEELFQYKIHFYNMFLWIIHCGSHHFKKTKSISIIYDIYKKYISEESLFCSIMNMKTYEKKKLIE